MARTLLVSPGQAGAFPTIRDALEVASDDAVITIAPGKYPEALNLDGRQLTLTANGERGSVVIDAEALGRPAITCRNGNITLQGLSLRAGDAAAVNVIHGRLQIRSCDATARYGAGISVTDGATIEATDVRVTGGQFGLLIEDSGGLVEESEIRDVAEDGIIVRLGADPTIRDTTVGGSGYRGVYVYQAGRPTLDHCEISQSGDVGISVAHQSAPTLRNCRVARCPGRRHHGRPGLPRIDRELHRRRDRRARHPRLTRALRRQSVEAGTGSAGTGSVGPRTIGRKPDGAGQQDPEKVEKLLAELDTMVGLAGVKAEVRALIDEIQVNEWRRNAGPAGRRGQPSPDLRRRARHRKDHRRPDLRRTARGAWACCPTASSGRCPGATWSASTSATPPRRPAPVFAEALRRRAVHRRGVHPVAVRWREAATSARRRSTRWSS